MNEPENHEPPKDALTHMGPMDSLLGSVSYNDSDGKTQQLRTSARVFKKMKFDLNTAVEKKEKKEEAKPEDTAKQENKKPANTRWTFEDRELFFEGLNEYGKDFESIHMYISTRLKRKGLGDDAIKTKHQVRHFYYKTYHSVCSYLKFSDKIPKNVQELYALINYGEIKKKTRLVCMKNWAKLNDLIAHGFVSIRVKGKTVKIKTPNCRALRRLNQLDEKYDDLKLPTRVVVELNPKDMASFVRVQSMAQNPRIKVALPLQKRLSSLISCIHTRWKSAEAVVYDKAWISTNFVTKDCVPDQKQIQENSLLLNPLLRLAPPQDAHCELPSVDISEYFTGQSISLTAFETRKCLKIKEETDICSEKIKENGSETFSTETTASFCKTEDTAPSSSTNNVNTVTKIEQIREGWTLENCGSLTIGEIYLMLGSNSKLCLEYSWDDGNKPKDENSVSNSLKKLLSLARLQSHRTEEVKCTCGHICGSKNNSQFKKPLPTKLVKKQQVNNDAASEKDKVITPITNVRIPENPLSQFFHSRNMQKLNPQMKSRGRGLFKQLVVERKLVPTQSEPNHEIVSMNIIPQEDSKSVDQLESVTCSPDVLLDDPSLLNESFSGILPDTALDSAMSPGISRLLEDNDPWINGDATDYSLSSLLGRLDSAKSNQSVMSVGTNDTQMPQDVEAQLHTLLIESSVDYTAQFADLAAQVVDNKKK